LVELLDNLYTKLDEREIVAGIYLDLQKAFDTVDHYILLNKVYKYGIRGKVWDWFKSYLTNRKQFVAIGDINSVTEVLYCGVPQGSILGPLLFFIYVNDIKIVSLIVMLSYLQMILMCLSPANQFIM